MGRVQGSTDWISAQTAVASKGAILERAAYEATSGRVLMISSAIALEANEAAGLFQDVGFDSSSV